MLYLQILFGAAASVFVHEMGHVLAQKVFRVPVKLFEFGKGPILIRTGSVEIRLIPLSGAVYPAGALIAPTKMGKVIIALSGVFAQWIMMYIIALTGLHLFSGLQTMCLTFGFCTLYATVMFLFPYRGTDSYYLVKALSRKKGD